MSVYVYLCSVLMLVALIFPLDADDTDSKCDSAVRVKRNTVYEASFGEELKIACPVTFCGGITPTVSWFKLKEEKFISVNISDRISTEWTRLNDAEGIHFLTFRNVLSRDNGKYRCEIRGEMSHTIHISVVGRSEVKVQHDTGYNTATGYPLKIHCPVDLTACDITPAVGWFRNETDGLMRINMSDRVTTEWIKINKYAAIYVLSFQHVLSSDTGQYQCRSDDSTSYFIHVFVTDPPNIFHISSFIYRSVIIIEFIMFVAIIYVLIKKRNDAAISRLQATNCANVKNPSNPQRQEDDALELQTFSDYENEL